MKKGDVGGVNYERLEEGGTSKQERRGIGKDKKTCGFVEGTRKGGGRIRL
jgi:hypothetical protein